MHGTERTGLNPKAMFIACLIMILAYSLVLAWTSPDAYVLSATEGAAFGLVLLLSHPGRITVSRCFVPVVFGALNAAYLPASIMIVLGAGVGLDAIGLKDLQMFPGMPLAAGLGGLLALVATALLLRPGYLSMKSSLPVFMLTAISGLWLSWSLDSEVLFVIHKASWWLGFCLALYITWHRSPDHAHQDREKKSE